MGLWMFLSAKRTPQPLFFAKYCMKKHHQVLLQTGNLTVPYRVYETACYGNNSHPLAATLYMAYCSEAHKTQSMTIPFSFEKFHKEWKFSNKELRQIHKVLVDHKCVEYAEGNDKRKKYIKILV